MLGVTRPDGPQASSLYDPSLIFVGRIIRQKGVPVLLRAASGLVPEAQLVLCASAPDTPELLAEVTELMDGLRTGRNGRARSGVPWIPEMLPKPEVIQLLTHAAVSACPSLYEPLDIVNLETMACETAVVGYRGVPSSATRHPAAPGTPCRPVEGVD